MQACHSCPWALAAHQAMALTSCEYRLHTRIPLRRGDQVYLLYGTYTNLELLGAQIT